MKRLLPVFLVLLFLCGYSGDGAVWYYTDGMYVTANKPGTWRGLQEAADKAKVDKRTEIALGPGIFDLDSTLWVHGNTTIKGSGIGKTILRRSSWTTNLTPYFGDVINSAPYGKHEPNYAVVGNSPKDSLANITIQDLTIDGNCTAFDPNSNPNTSNHFGIQFWFVDGVLLKNVQVTNTFQTGIELDACRNAEISGCETKNTGRQVQLGTRNGINLNNNSGNLVLSSIWARNLNINNTRITNARGANIDCANVSDVNISSIIMTNDFDPISNQGPPGQDGNFAFEFEGSITGYIMQNFTINNIICRGLNNRFFTKGGSIQLDGLKCSNVDFTAADSSFSGAIAIGANAGGVRNIRFNSCTFRNMNGKNIDGNSPFNTAAFIYCYRGNAATDTIRDIVFKDITMIGANSAGPTHTANRGMQIGGNLYNFTAENINIINAEDIGVWIGADGSNTAREITLKNVVVDGARNAGFRIDATNITGSVNGVRFLNCVAKDTNKASAGASFAVIASTGSIKNTRFQDCRIIRTSGTNMQGLLLSQSSSGVVDTVYVLNNEFLNSAAPDYNTVGTITNVFRGEINTGTGYGGSVTGLVNPMDNNVWFNWKDSGSTSRPFMKVDSVNTIRFQTMPSGSANIDFYKPDGTLGIRWAGASNAFNVTNAGIYQNNGFRLFADSSNVRKVFMKSNGRDNAGVIVSGWALRDSADTKDFIRQMIDPSTTVLDSLYVKKQSWHADTTHVNSLVVGHTQGIYFDNNTGARDLFAKRPSATTTDIFVPATGAGAAIRFRNNTDANNILTLNSDLTATFNSTLNFSGLPSANDGSIIYCNDCSQTTPCGGSGTGAFARRTNGAWDCFGGPATGTANLDFDLTSVAFQDLTITVTGAVVNASTPMRVVLGIPTAANPVDTGIMYFAWVSAANTVRVRCMRSCDAAFNPSPGNFTASVYP